MDNTQLESLDAYILALEEGADVALKRLAGRVDPESLRRRIAILIEANRSGEAAELVRAAEPNEQFCEVAVRALVRSGDRVSARKTVDWAKSHAVKLTSSRCAVFFAHESLAALTTGRPTAEILPGGLSSDDEATVREALDALAPVVASVGNRIENELERQAVEGALRGYDLLGDLSASERCATVLSTRRPLPLILAELAIAKRIRPIDALSERLREEHPHSFPARLLAALADAKLSGLHREAFTAARQLATEPLAENERDSLSRTLVDLARNAGEQAQQEADELAKALSPGGRLARLREAEELLRKGNLADANQILEETRDEDDPLWLQLAANLHLQRHEEKTATTLLLKATLILPDPDLLSMTANVAYHHDSPEAAIDPMRRLTLVRPDDASARRRLVALYVQTGDLPAAMRQYQELVDRSSAEDTDRLNYASLLVRSGDPEKGLSVLAPLAAQAQPSVEAVVAMSDVLLILGRTEEAFDALWLRRDTFWDDPGFVQRVLQTGFRSGHESEGHQAMLHLRQLQSEGRAEAAMLQEVRLDAVVDTLKQRHTTIEDLHRKVIVGQAPWLLVDLAFGNPAYLAWAIRTQQLRWVYDEPVNRAQHSIYSTNSFALRGPTSARRLEELECSPKGMPVVGDLSSLVTLHRLGLLDHAAQFFGTIMIPLAYIANVVGDAERLLPHQPSRYDAAFTVKRAIDEGKLTVTDEDRDIRLFEYTSTASDSEYYTIRDALEVLHANGRLSDSQYSEALKVAHRPPRADSAHPPMKLAQRVATDVLTLGTIAQAGILPMLSEAFNISITATSHEELVSQLRQFDTQRNVWAWNNDLWKTIRSDPRFLQSTPTLPADWKEHADHPGIYVPLASVALARQTKAPLLADDRVCQMVVLNENNTAPPAAFGSDRLLLALNEAGLIDANAAANAFLQLAAWRYRFMIIPPSLLKILADRFKQHPPGADLRSVAMYVHDCMRDAGLFRGKEATDPPVSMANMLFVRWTGTIAEFLMDVWMDDGWEEAQAAELTRWGVAALLPSPPTSSSLAETASSPRITSKIVISRALVRASQATNAERANRALLAMADELGMTRTEYLDTVAEVLNGVSNSR